MATPDWKPAVYCCGGTLLAVLVAAVPIGFAPRAAGTAQTLVALGLVAGLSFIDLAAPANRIRSSRRITTAADRQARRLATATGIALLVTLWLGFAWPHRIPAQAVLVTCAASFLSAAGISLRAIAIQTLGRDFVTEVSVNPQKAGRLRKTGIYAYVRHPSELGLLLFVFGWVGVQRSGAAFWFATAALVPLTIVRLRLEDAELSRGFGQDHQRYRRRVSALIPGGRVSGSG